MLYLMVRPSTMRTGVCYQHQQAVDWRHLNAMVFRVGTTAVGIGRYGYRRYHLQSSL